MAGLYCETVAHPDQVARLTRTAVQNTVGKQGAAVLVLPGDILAEHSDHPLVTGATVGARPRPAPTPEEVGEQAGRIAAAGSVAIFAGIGCTGAREEVLQLAARLHAPVGHSLRGKDVIGYDNPFKVGMIGLLGYGACYQALHDADLVLLLGTGSPYDDFLPTANNVQVDIDPARLGRRVPVV